MIVRFSDAYVAEVTPGARVGPLQNTTEDARKALDRADARVVQQTKLVATGRCDRHRRQPGDVVTLTFTRAQAVTIEKAP